MPEAGEALRPGSGWKDPAGFVRHGTNLETRLEELDGLITPNDLFFVRNHAPTPVIDPGSYLLSVGGPGAESEGSSDSRRPARAAQRRR